MPTQESTRVARAVTQKYPDWFADYQWATVAGMEDGTGYPIVKCSLCIKHKVSGVRFVRGVVCRDKNMLTQHASKCKGHLGAVANEVQSNGGWSQARDNALHVAKQTLSTSTAVYLAIVAWMVVENLPTRKFAGLVGLITYAGAAGLTQSTHYR